jgi:hypothetical protein
VVEGGEGLLQRGGRVVPVHLPQVDVVGAEPAQRRVQRAQQVAARAVAAAVTVRSQAGLGGEHHLVARHEMVEQRADHRLGVAVAVHVGGVDRRAARLQIELELGSGVVGVGVASPGHGAEGESGDRQPASAERSLLHE